MELLLWAVARLLLWLHLDLDRSEDAAGVRVQGRIIRRQVRVASRRLDRTVDQAVLQMVDEIRRELSGDG